MKVRAQNLHEKPNVHSTLDGICTARERFLNTVDFNIFGSQIEPLCFPLNVPLYHNPFCDVAVAAVS